MKGYDAEGTLVVALSSNCFVIYQAVDLRNVLNSTFLTISVLAADYLSKKAMARTSILSLGNSLSMCAGCRKDV